MAGGYPLSALVGRKDILELANPGQKGRGKYCFLSGTLTGNPVSCAAGLAALTVLQGAGGAGVYARLNDIGRRLADGLCRLGKELGVPLQVLGDGPVLQVYFTEHRPLRNHRDLLRADRNKAVRFGHELIRRGIYCTPGGKLYLSLAHSDADIERTIDSARDALETALGR